MQKQNAKPAADILEVSDVRFLTGSSFEGSWNEVAHMMDGFGTYRYPDGSEYRGRFFEGKFHGFGHLKLAPPYRFTIKGEFLRGKLVTIEDMWFNDGLHVKGNFKNEQFHCDNWDYLTPTDRRYHAERFYGQQPVGPTSYLTSSLMERAVPKDCFDVEEGLFNAESGWVLDRQPPFSPSVYVSCPKEKKWIIQNCRGEHNDILTEPMPKFCRQIIANNLETEQIQLKNITIYAPSTVIDRERYFPKICKERPEKQNLPRHRSTCAPVTNTEVCVNAHELKGIERTKDFEKQIGNREETLPALPRARRWTSSSDARSIDSGATQSLSMSLSDMSLPQRARQFYDTAQKMTIKKPTESLYVVQSNMKRPCSYVDIARSIFEL